MTSLAEQVNDLEARERELTWIAERAILQLGRITDFEDRNQCWTYAWLERDYQNVTGKDLS